MPWWFISSWSYLVHSIPQGCLQLAQDTEQLLTDSVSGMHDENQFSRIHQYIVKHSHDMRVWPKHGWDYRHQTLTKITWPGSNIRQSTSFIFYPEQKHWFISLQDRDTKSLGMLVYSLVLTVVNMHGYSIASNHQYYTVWVPYGWIWFNGGSRIAAVWQKSTWKCILMRYFPKRSYQTQGRSKIGATSSQLPPVPKHVMYNRVTYWQEQDYTHNITHIHVHK